jgi:FkbM family methyltransferase
MTFAKRQLARVAKPQYILRPRQVVRRMRVTRAPERAKVTSQMPWGLTLTYDPRDELGSSVARTGVYELPVTEAMFRLSDPGELAIDIGANIGYMTGVLAVAVGPAGSVLAFEPHPALHGELLGNVAAWRRRGGVAEIEVHQTAVSADTGSALLYVPAGFGANRGTSSLDAIDALAAAELEVRTVTLDAVLEGRGPVGLLKIDVEGHEEAVLQGARRLLRSRAVRDILFEEHRALPTPVTRRLEAEGYTVLGLAERLAGLRLADPTADASRARWHAQTYLATHDPVRARRRIRGLGWIALGTPRRRRLR